MTAFYDVQESTCLVSTIIVESGLASRPANRSLCLAPISFGSRSFTSLRGRIRRRQAGALYVI